MQDTIKKVTEYFGAMSYSSRFVVMTFVLVAISLTNANSNTPALFITFIYAFGLETLLRIPHNEILQVYLRDWFYFLAWILAIGAWTFLWLSTTGIFDMAGTHLNQIFG